MSAEIIICGSFDQTHALASMGPHFYECGNSVLGIEDKIIIEASMGPHFYECGNKDESMNKLGQLKLQWGRTFMSAEIGTPFEDSGTRDELQWGRTFMSAEIRDHAALRRAGRAASMGPHFYECGNLAAVPGVGRRGGASMGPHFYECGNPGLGSGLKK